jgi:hypothetical protein
MLFSDQPENFTGPWCGSHDGWRPSVPFHGTSQAAAPLALFVMPGLDPGIHHLRKKPCYEEDGLPGQARQRQSDQTFST